MPWDPNVPDADDWTTCAQGHTHWGTAGAAGLMLHHQDQNGVHRYLMQQRSPFVDHPLTWAPPSGALQHGEHPTRGAMREAFEELGPFQATNPQVAHVNDHGGWAFHTVTADSPTMFDPEEADWTEHQDHAWLTPEEIDELPLHPGFRESWNELRPQPRTSKTKTPAEARALPERREKRRSLERSTVSYKVSDQSGLSSEDVDPTAQVLDQLTMQSVAHNLHYKYEQGPLTAQEATEYAARLLDMMGYRNPDEMTISTALNAWHQLYPQDKQLNQGPPVQPVFEAPPTVPTNSWGYGTVSAVSAPPVPALYHWTDAANLHDWMDDSHTGPGETYLTEHGDAPDDESWNPDVPMMMNPVRLTIDHHQLDPDHWDDTYHGWLNNYLYRGPIPRSAVKEIKAFPPAETWDMPEHWAKTAGPVTDEMGRLRQGIPDLSTGLARDWAKMNIDWNPEPADPETATAPPQPTSPMEMAVNHTGQIPGDERWLGNIENYEDNPDAGVNPSYIGQIEPPEGEAGVWPQVYVKPAGHFHTNDLVNERAAFGLAHEMGVPMPHTVVRNIPHPGGYDYTGAHDGSMTPALVQQGIEDAEPLGISHQPDEAVRQWPDETRRISLFDHVIGNVDRHMNNVVQSPNGELYAIDHGGAFSPSYYGPHPLGFANHFDGEPLTPEEEDALQRAYNHPLETYGLDDHAIQGARLRIQDLLNRGRFPGGYEDDYDEDTDPNHWTPAPRDSLKQNTEDRNYWNHVEKGLDLDGADEACLMAHDYMKDVMDPEAAAKHLQIGGTGGNTIHDDAAYYAGHGDKWPEAYKKAIEGARSVHPEDFYPQLADEVHAHMLDHMRSELL